MAGRNALHVKKKLTYFSWGKLVIMLIMLLASLQVLHMMLLNRLEEKKSHLQKEKAVKTLQEETHHLYKSMKLALENTPIVDASGQYRIVNFFYDTTKHQLAPSHFSSTPKYKRNDNEKMKPSVTIVSQCSVNHLPHLANLSQRWKGPVSVSVFATDDQSIKAAINYMVDLYYCVPSMRDNISIHLVYPLVHSISTLIELWPTEATNSTSCNHLQKPLSHKLEQSRNYALSRRVMYPNNLLRNVAIGNIQTDYVFVIDIDMTPNVNLHNDFRNFVYRHSLTTQNKALDERTIYVVPAFELQHGSNIPADKKYLLHMWRHREVRPFYYEMCWRCQKPTEYEAWRNLSHVDRLSIGYEVEWKDPWEPFYIGSKNIPLYDERFKQYGFNRISQVCQMHVAGYKFVVLSNAFLVHDGFKTPDTFHLTKDMEQERNRLIFRQFKEELKNKYPDSQKRCY